MTENNLLWRFRNEHEDLGPFGEAVWSTIMRKCGFSYIPLADLPVLNGKGPRIRSDIDDILPDFDVSTDGIEVQRAYMDSKCKTQSVLWEKWNEIRHGIDRRCWDCYDFISSRNRQKCILGIIELFDENRRHWSGSLLMQTLARLGPPIPGIKSQRHMVYWPRLRFYEIGKLSVEQLWELSLGKGSLPEQVRTRMREAFAKPDTQIQTRIF